MLNVHAKKLETVAVLGLYGRIINGETEKLRQAVRNVSGATAIILDLKGVTTVDAHGLGVLIDLRQRTLAKGARFELMNVSQPLRRIFEITRLDSVFDITYGVEFFPAVARARRVPVMVLKPCA